MNPLPNEWVIKHRSDVCAVTRRPFVPGEYFYTLLFHEADGYRREDLSEEAWRTRNENIRPFSFWRSRFEPLPTPAPEPLPRENAEQLFRRLIASEKPPVNACYVLAVMLERKRTGSDLRAGLYWRCLSGARPAIAPRRTGDGAKRSGRVTAGSNAKDRTTNPSTRLNEHTNTASYLQDRQ